MLGEGLVRRQSGLVVVKQLERSYQNSTGVVYSGLQYFYKGPLEIYKFPNTKMQYRWT